MGYTVAKLISNICGVYKGNMYMGRISIMSNKNRANVG